MRGPSVWTDGPASGLSAVAATSDGARCDQHVSNQRITLTLNRRAFACYGPDHNDWKIDPSRFVIRMGDASNHRQLNADLTMEKAR